MDSSPIITIGNFDGVHLGHQALLKRMLEKGPQTCVVTFSNHPAEVLRGQSPPRLLSLEHKLRLLDEHSIFKTLLLPFTKELSELSAGAFLKSLNLPLKSAHLVLGYDAVIGHKRQGTPVEIERLSKKHGFTFEYLSPIESEGEVVSSRLIRQKLQHGELKRASDLLGRPYSILGHVESGSGVGRTIGFRTANLSLEGLATPPFGVYITTVKVSGKKLHSVSNLGLAPTLRPEGPPLFEVHLINEAESLYGETIEVIFERFLRKEKKFSSKEALRSQIAKDVEMAKRYFRLKSLDLAQ